MHRTAFIVVALSLLVAPAKSAWYFQNQVCEAPTGSYAELWNDRTGLKLDSVALTGQGRADLAGATGDFTEDDTAIVRVFNSTGQSQGETRLPGSLIPSNIPPSINYPPTITAGAQSNVTAYNLADRTGREGPLEVFTLFNDGRYLLVDTINEHPPQGTLEPYIHELSVAIPPGTWNCNLYFLKRKPDQPGYCWADSTDWMQVPSNGPYGPNVEHLTTGAYDTYDVWLSIPVIPLPQAGIHEERTYPVPTPELPTHLRLAALSRLMESLPNTEVYDPDGRRIETPGRNSGDAIRDY
ncbi:hypothetical protein JXB37_08970 [candidate division WOR-3 bacterium]|nr:hypothetical protein [candidate division WOR-3 bacterium]